MSVVPSPVWNGIAFQDLNDNLLASGRIYTYAGGSWTAQQTTYTTSEGNIPNSNPIILNASGRQNTGFFLTPNIYYNMKLTDAYGNVIATQEAIYATPFIGPGAPGGNTSCEMVPATPTLTWTVGTIGTYPLQGYQVFRSTDEVHYTEIGSTNASTFAFTDSTGSASTTYYYYIVAVDTQGNLSSPSAVQSCTIPSLGGWSLVFQDTADGGSNVFTQVAVKSTTEAIALGATTTTSFKTTDGGSTWNAITTPVVFGQLVWNGTYYVGWSEYPWHFYYSTNGASWTNIDPPADTSNSGTDYQYNPTTGDIYFTYSYGTGNVDLFKLPGGSLTWSTLLTNAPGPEGEGTFKFGYNGSTIIGGHTLGSGPTTLYKSTDGGSSWTSVLTAPTHYQLFVALWNGSEWTANGGIQTSPFNNINYTSPDGTTWTLQNNTTYTNPPFYSREAVFSNLFVTNDHSTNIGTSSDGVTWSTNVLPVVSSNSGLTVVGSKIFAYGPGMASSTSGTSFTNEFDGTSLQLSVYDLEADSTGGLILAVGAYNSYIGNAVIYKRN